jgi:hypothetical protein
MPLSRESIVFDVHDCKIWPMVTDVTGASPTYGAAVDVFGIAQVGVDPNLITAELKGDARVIAKKGRLDRINFSGTYGKLSLPVLTVLLSATVTSAGTTPNEIVKGRLIGGVAMPYFKIGVQLQDVDLGLAAISVIIYKAQITGGSLINTQSDQFGQPTFDAEGVALDGSLQGTASVMADIFFDETLRTLEVVGA